MAIRRFRFKVVGAEGRKELSSEDKKAGDASKAKPTAQIWLLTLNGGEAKPLTDISGGVQKVQMVERREKDRVYSSRSGDQRREERERKERKYDEIEVDKNYKYDRLFVYDLATQEATLVT